MKPISGVANKIQSEIGHGQSPSIPSRRQPDREKQIDQLNDLLRQLCAIFPGWRGAAGKTNDQQQAWLKSYRLELLAAFRDQKVRPGDIARGLKRAREQDTDFMPNPGKFARWCKEVMKAAHKPGVSGLPEKPSDVALGRSEFQKIRRREFIPARYVS